MMSRLKDWLPTKWQRTLPLDVLRAYAATFSTPDGRVVLQHLMDEVYCTTCPTNDPIALATHNGRRSVVQELLENLDVAEQPQKYTPHEETVSA